jgi:putative ABC transport system permease protein
MGMKPTTKKAFKDVTRRKVRTVLTVLGIAIGVMGLSAVMLASGQLQSSLKFSTDASAQPDIQLFTTPASSSLIALLQQQSNVQQAQAETIVPTRWVIPGGHEALTIFGLPDFQHVAFNRFELAAGRLPTGPGEILMESSDRQISTFHVGDQIELTSPGGSQRLTVVGLTRTRGLPAPGLSGNATAYMRLVDVQRLFQVPGVNTFLIRLAHYEPRQAQATAGQLAQVLRAHGVTVLSVSVGHADGEGQLLLDGLFAVMQVLSAIALLLSVFLLLGTITTLLSEQIPVIGTLKAMGARRYQIMRSYLLTVLIYGLLGSVIGLVLGLVLGTALVNYLADLMTLDVGPLALSPTLFVISLAVGLAVPLLAALLPVSIGTRITVQQALSGYGLASEHQGIGWSRLARAVAGFLPQTMQLGIRTLFRKRLRTILTMLTLVFAGSAFLCVQVTTSSFSAVLDQIFSNYHADIFVSFNTPQPSDRMISTVAAVEGVAVVEPADEITVQTDWGESTLTGLLPDAQLYGKRMLAGRWFTAADQNVVVISNVAAAKSGLQVGSSIEIRNNLNSVRWQVIGIVEDYINPAEMGTLLAPLSQVNRFAGLPATDATDLMIRSTSPNQADVDALAARLDARLGQLNIQATIQTAHQEIERNQSQFLILYVLLYCVVVIIALVGALSLLNILTMSVLERRREIGILRAMGATGRKVAQVFWMEGVTLAILAWGAALIVGLPAAYGFIQLLGKLLLPVPFTLNPLSLGAMLLFIVAVASLASLSPSWGAARVKVAQVLRYE